MQKTAPTAEPCKFPVWKSVQIGTMKTADDFRRALRASGYRVGTWANDILGRFTPAATEQKLDLVVVSATDLGFPNGATLADIYGRAQKLGLELCPADVGPQLRLQYADQPHGEWLAIAMEPITDSDGYPSIFIVGHDDDDRWLIDSYGFAADVWNGDRRFVFVLRK